MAHMEIHTVAMRTGNEPTDSPAHKARQQIKQKRNSNKYATCCETLLYVGATFDTERKAR